MGRLYQKIPKIYLEINSRHIAVINAVSVCSVSRQVLSIDFFVWFWMTCMQVAIFQWSGGGFNFHHKGLTQSLFKSQVGLRRFWEDLYVHHGEGAVFMRFFQQLHHPYEEWGL